MLSRLLDLIEHTQGGLGLHELCRQLDAPPEAVQGMLELLIRKGRLVALGPDGGICTECATKGECNLLAWLGPRYVLAPRSSRN